jgi:hypothetical protein
MNALFYPTSKCRISKVFGSSKNAGTNAGRRRREAPISLAVEASAGVRCGFRILVGLELVYEQLMRGVFGHLLESFPVRIPPLSTQLFQCDRYESVSIVWWAHQPLQSRKSL